VNLGVTGWVNRSCRPPHRLGHHGGQPRRFESLNRAAVTVLTVCDSDSLPGVTGSHSEMESESAVRRVGLGIRDSESKSSPTLMGRRTVPAPPADFE